MNVLKYDDIIKKVTKFQSGGRILHLPPPDSLMSIKAQDG